MGCVKGTRESTEVVVDGRILSYDEVVAVARHGAPVVLAEEVLPRPAYGLTTGLAGGCGRRAGVEPAASAVLGRGPEFLGRAIREVVPRPDDDRPCGVDVETVSRDILESDDVRCGPRALTGEASTMVGGAA